MNIGKMKTAAPDPLLGPPQDPEAEQSVLGAMVLSKDAILLATQLLGPADFYREAHSALFQAITALFDRGESVDALTLSAELRSRRIEGGSLRLLLEAVERVPTAANVEHYASVVRRLSRQRRCIAFLARKASELRAFDCDPEKITDELLDFCSAGQAGEGDLLSADLGDLALEVRDKILRARKGERSPHIPSGFREFDRKFGGWQRGALTTIEAPPKVGKSFFMMNSMNLAASRGGSNIGYLILDMSRETLLLRLLSLRLHRTIPEIQGPEVALEAVEEELAALQSLPIRVAGEENVGSDLKRILRWMAYAKRHFGIDLFFVDSFTKIEVRPEKGQTDESYISQMVNAFQRAAKTLDAAVVGTVDLNYEGHAKGSSRWGYGPDAVFRLSLSEDKNLLTAESKFLRNHASGKAVLSANYRWSEVRDLEVRPGAREARS